MAAGLYDITIEQGADWNLSMTWRDATGQPVNLAGYTARMQVRETWASKAKVFDLSTENGLITLGESVGVVAMKIPAAVSAAVVVPPAKVSWVEGKQAQQMVFDVELVNQDGAVTRLLQGSALFVPEVTR